MLTVLLTNDFNAQTSKLSIVSGDELLKPIFQGITHHPILSIVPGNWNPNERFVDKSIAEMFLITANEKRAAWSTARLFSLNPIPQKGKLVTGLLLILRPKSNQLKRIGRVPTNTDARKPLCPEFPMVAIGSKERAVQEQLPTVSVWKVAFVHNRIISLDGRNDKWIN